MKSALFLFFCPLALVPVLVPVHADPAAADNPAAALDFWIGDWALTWESKDGMAHGANHISRMLDGKVIREDFSTAGESPFRGHSVSVYDAKREIWRQTWVDNNGGYLVFEGGPEGDAFVLYGLDDAKDREGKPVDTRMVFKDIEDDTLTWSWEYSWDGGESWKPIWVIQYRRQ